MKSSSVKRLATLAMFLALAVLLNYVENLLPMIVPVPGVKLGLANTMNLIILYYYGRRDYFAIGLLRVLLMAVMFTGVVSYAFFLSLSGFLLSSLVVIGLSYIKKLSIFSLSVASAIFHGIGQICCAILLYWTNDGSSIFLFTYLPILIVSGAITGVLIAYLSYLIITRLNKTSLFRDIN